MFFNFLSRDDIFISYSRRDGAAYAAGLADELTALKFSCFIDKLGTEPDRDLPASLRRTIRNCTLFVVVGTECAAASEFVAREIEEFRKTRRTIVPVDFGGAVGRARWYGLIPGLAAEPEENPDARRIGDPSDNVVKRIEKSFNYTRRNQRMMRALIATLSLFLLLLAASGAAAYVAASNLREARRQSRAAEESTRRAEEQTRVAAEAASRAEEQTRRAEDAARQARDAEQLRDLAGRKTAAAERKAAEAARLERQARARADEQRKRADEQQRRAEEQFRRGTNLVYASNMLVAQQSYETGRAEYGQSLLDSYQPRYTEVEGGGVAPVAAEDQRGFEWRYLWRVYHKVYQPDPDFLRPTVAAYSPDGKWLAAAGRRGVLELWDTSAYSHIYGAAMVAPPRTLPGGQDRRQELSTAASALTFSPDSRLLAAGTLDGKLQLFEVAVTEDLLPPQYRTTHNRLRLRFTGRSLPLEFTPRASPVTSLAFSPDGRTLAAAFESGPPVFFDVATQRPSETPFALAAVEASTLAYSPDGKWLALGRGDRVSLWETAGGGQPLALDWGAATLKALAFSPDSKLLAANSGDGKAKIWNVAARREVEAARRLDGQAEALAFSPDGRIIATLGPGAEVVRLRDSATYEEVETLALRPPRPQENAFSVERHRRNSSQSQQSLPPSLRGRVLVFSPDSAALAGYSAGGTLVLWNTSPNPFVMDAKTQVAKARYSPDGKVIVTAGSDGTLQVWDARRRKLAHSIRIMNAAQGEESAPGAQDLTPVFAFSPDGRTLAVSADDGRAVRLLDAGSYKDLYTFRVVQPDAESESRVTALAFSPDGARLAVSAGAATYLYDATKLRGAAPPPAPARLLEPIKGDEASTENDQSDVTSLVFLRGGQVLATASMYTVRLWDVRARSLLWRFPFSWSHEGPLGELALSPDGRQLAVSTAFWLRLYDVELLLAGDAREYLDLRGPARVAGDVAFSPDGKTLASAMEDGSVKLWNTVAGHELITLRGHEGKVSAVTFSPDGHALASGGDNTLKLWLAATDEEVSAQPTYQEPGD